jgi:putative flippase GtrA
MIAVSQARSVGIKLLSFAVVGVVNSLVDLGVFSLAYFYFEAPLVFSNVVAWSCAVTGSYVLNSFTTFARESGRALGFTVYVRFIASQVAGLLVNTATIVVASYVMPVLIGKLLAIFASFLVNFSLSHFVVFRERIVAGPARGNAARLAWICPAAVALIILVALGANRLFHPVGTPSATDVSSRSRLAPSSAPP